MQTETNTVAVETSAAPSNQLALFGPSFNLPLGDRLAVKQRKNAKGDRVVSERIGIKSIKDMATVLGLSNTKENHGKIMDAVMEQGQAVKLAFASTIAKLQQDARTIGTSIAKSVNKGGDETVTLTFKRFNPNAAPAVKPEELAATLGISVEDVKGLLAAKAKAEATKAIEVTSEAVEAK